MGTKKNSQPEFVFQLPSAAKITNDYFDRYVFISDFLDSHPEIVGRIHKDLRKPVAKAQRKGPQGQACSFSPDTVLRLCLVQRLEDTSYRVLAASRNRVNVAVSRMADEGEHAPGDVVVRWPTASRGGRRRS